MSKKLGQDEDIIVEDPKTTSENPKEPEFKAPSPKIKKVPPSVKKSKVQEELVKKIGENNIDPIVLVDGPNMPNIEIDSSISLEELERTLIVVDPTISPKGSEIKFTISKVEYLKLRELARTINQQYTNSGKKVDDYIMFRLEYAFHLIQNVLKAEITGDALWLISTKIRVRIAQEYYDSLNTKILEAQGTPFSGEEVRKMTEALNEHKNHRDSLVKYMKEQGFEDPADQIEIKPTCYYCYAVQDKPLEKIMKCSGCKTAVYCNATCQRDDWSRHQKACQNQDPRAARMLTIRKFVKTEIETFIISNPYVFENQMKFAKEGGGIPSLTITLGMGPPQAGKMNDPKTIHKNPNNLTPQEKKDVKEYEEIYNQFKKIPNCLVIIILDPKGDEIERIKNEQLKKEGKKYETNLQKTVIIDYVSVTVKELNIIKEMRKDVHKENLKNMHGKNKQQKFGKK